VQYLYPAAKQLGQDLVERAIDAPRALGTAEDEEYGTVRIKIQRPAGGLAIRQLAQVAAHRVARVDRQAGRQVLAGLAECQGGEIGQPRPHPVHQTRKGVLLVQQDSRAAEQQAAQQPGGEDRWSAGVAAGGEDQVRAETEDPPGGLEHAHPESGNEEQQGKRPAPRKGPAPGIDDGDAPRDGVGLRAGGCGGTRRPGIQDQLLRAAPGADVQQLVSRIGGQFPRHGQRRVDVASGSPAGEQELHFRRPSDSSSDSAGSAGRVLNAARCTTSASRG